MNLLPLEEVVRIIGLKPLIGEGELLSVKDAAN